MQTELMRDAWLNHWADQVAGSPLHWCSRHAEMYRRLIREFRSNRVLAVQVMAFRARVGSYFSGAKTGIEDRVPVVVPNWVGFREA